MKSSWPRSRTRAAVGIDEDPLWYKDAVIYEVRTRSFFDSNDDGLGDLKGLTSKLDYLADLGVTALWLLPHYPSPGRDDGYDIADYRDVHTDVGTLQDFDELIAESHRRGIRVITELVLNHTSDQHPWFQRARRAPAGSPERDFYVWTDNAEKYKDARIIFRDFEASNWTWDALAKAFFWHRFYSHQPDLNFANPEVQREMFAVVDFWLARGVDGLRLDAVPYLYEEEGTNCENLPATHVFLKQLRAHIDEKFKNRMLLAEANQWPEDAAAYFGQGDECHMNFHFPIMPRMFMAIHMEDRFPIIDILRQTPELHPNCQWAMFLRNHDELTLEMVTDEERDYMYRAYAHEAQMRINLGIRRRLAPLTGNSRRKMELLNGLLFSLPGTPVLYYGDEIGMGDNVYLGDRNGVRTPMQWSAERNAGFSRANGQKLVLPVIVDAEYHHEALNVQAQQSNPSSFLWWTKRLIALRKRYRAFGRGTVDFLHPANPRVLAFVRRYEDEVILVVANLSRFVQYVELEMPYMRGWVPVELMGRTKFPVIGDQPYMLTLGPHAFYWFSLTPPLTQSVEARMSDFGHTTLVCSSAESLLYGSDRPALEDALPAFLDARGWLSGPVSNIRIVEAFPIAGELVVTFVRIEYTEEEAETLFLLLAVSRGDTPERAGTIVAHLDIKDGEGGAVQHATLVEATSEGAAKALFEAVVRGSTFRSKGGHVVAESLPGVSIEEMAGRDPRVLTTDRLGAAFAYGDAFVLKLLYRVEEGTAPELEVGRSFQARGIVGLTPEVAGFVEHRVGRSEPVTLAVLERFVPNEGTAWNHARAEIGRAYERALAHSPGQSPPTAPSGTLFDLALMTPPKEHMELLGAYPSLAELLGKRTAELHLALASDPSPGFVPQPWLPMDQRSSYQSKRNLVGRTLGLLRRSMSAIPEDAREHATQLLDNEERLLARFEWLRSRRIETMQTRTHGDLHLGRLLFTGKDFVFLGIGGGNDRRLAERRRKGSCFRDVASLIRSFDYATATALRSLRPADQELAEHWGWVWERWISGAFLRGYVGAAAGAPFLPADPQLATIMLDSAILEKAFVELRNELRVRPEQAWIPLSAIVRACGM